MNSTSPHRPNTIAGHEAAVQKVIRHMKSNLIGWDADLSLSALAREGCYSKSHLIEIFEELTGTTPHHFLTSLRIQKGKELLLNTRASVTEIALEVGYHSFPTFSRTFSEYVGLPPSEFRKCAFRQSLGSMLRSALAFLSRPRHHGTGTFIEGSVLAPPNAHGLFFVGLFRTGIPKGRPIAGTVLLRPGDFRILFSHDIRASDRILAAQIPLPFSRKFFEPVAPVSLVASAPFCSQSSDPIFLKLRPRKFWDPPIVVYLPALLDAF